MRGGSRFETSLARYQAGIEHLKQKRYPKRYSVAGNAVEEEGNGLLMEMFHRGGAEDDEEPHPERGALKGYRLIIVAFLFFVLI